MRIPIDDLTNFLTIEGVIPTTYHKVIGTPKDIIIKVNKDTPDTWDVFIDGIEVLPEVPVKELTTKVHKVLEELR